LIGVVLLLGILALIALSQWAFTQAFANSDVLLGELAPRSWADFGRAVLNMFGLKPLTGVGPKTVAVLFVAGFGGIPLAGSLLKWTLTRFVYTGEIEQVDSAPEELRDGAHARLDEGAATQAAAGDVTSFGTGSQFDARGRTRTEAVFQDGGAE
jgi:hypothetical protein